MVACALTGVCCDTQTAMLRACLTLSLLLFVKEAWPKSVGSFTQQCATLVHVCKTCCCVFLILQRQLFVFLNQAEHRVAVGRWAVLVPLLLAAALPRRVLVCTHQYLEY